VSRSLVPVDVVGALTLHHVAGGHRLEQRHLVPHPARHDEVGGVAGERLGPVTLAGGLLGRGAEPADERAREVLQRRQGGLGAVVAARHEVEREQPAGRGHQVVGVLPRGVGLDRQRGERLLLGRSRNRGIRWRPTTASSTSCTE
jgi:hypothetical protein